MFAAFGQISSLLAGVGIMTLGYGFLGTLLAVRMTVEGFGTFTSGLVMAAYFAGLVIGSLTGAQAVRAVGHIRVFTAYASLFSAATLMHVFFIDPWIWGGLRLIEGFCMAGLFLCVESWLNDRSSNEQRGQVLGLYMIVTYLFGGAAQFLLLLGTVEGFFLFAVTSVLASLALVPVALSRSPAPAIPESRVFGLRRLLEISPVGVMGCFVAGLASGAFYALGPRFGAVTGLDALGIASLMGFAIFGGLLFQVPLGRLSDRIDRRRVLMGSGLGLAAAGAGLTALAMVTVGPLPLWAFLVVLFFGGMLFALYPLSLAHANDHIDPQDFVAAAGGLILSFSIGATIGPIAASAVMAAAGAAGLFVFIGASGIALAAFAWVRLRINAPLPSEDKTPFQVTPRTALAVTELDPRSEDDFGQLSFDFSAPPPEPETPAAEV